MSYPRELDECIFCGDSDMTEEHLIAAWVLRAFHRQRKPDAGLSGSFVGPGQMRLSPDEPISTAKVVCRSCNNEWLSVVDNAAADVLKPLIRGDATVTLDGEGQAPESLEGFVQIWPTTAKPVTVLRRRGGRPSQLRQFYGCRPDLG